MNREDLVTMAIQGAFGKPSSALILQSDWFIEQLRDNFTCDKHIGAMRRYFA